MTLSAQADQSRTVVVSADALAAADLSICAATGVGTDLTCTELAYNLPRPIYWIQRTVGLIGFSGILVAFFVRSAAVRLPIAAPLWRRMRRYEMLASTALVAGLGVLFLSLAFRNPALAFVGLVALTVPFAVYLWKRNHWVKVGDVQHGWVKIGGCHPRFVEELETREIQILA